MHAMSHVHKTRQRVLKDNERLAKAASASGRDVRSLPLFMAIMAETDEEARAKWDSYREGADLAAGEKIYKATCGVCHETGVAGAPKHGDKAAWKPRLEQGVAVLDKHAIEGIRAMPPRGGNAKLTDAEVRNAVAYMIAAVQ